MTTSEEISFRISQILAEVEKAIVGKRSQLEYIMAAILVPGGHILLDDFPGLAKTMTANSFATAMGILFKRIQFTPDLLPMDITGGYIYDRAQNNFVLRKGPIFANIILADEINRASPRTQSALLEAMQENQVTIEGTTMPLPDPFIVIATQNPIEYEGTFPLPEAQLDRFLIKMPIGYPSRADEKEILKRRLDRKSEQMHLKPVASAESLNEMRQAVEEVYVEPDLQQYIVDLVAQTRVHRKIAVGSSPRGALALIKIARAWALIQRRAFVLPDDVKQFMHLALSHRIILEPDLWGVQRATSDVIEEIFKSVPVPVV
jgi:MoxR-like ATPase